MSKGKIQTTPVPGRSASSAWGSQARLSGKASDPGWVHIQFWLIPVRGSQPRSWELWDRG